MWTYLQTPGFLLNILFLICTKNINEESEKWQLWSHSSTFVEKMLNFVAAEDHEIDVTDRC